MKAYREKVVPEHTTKECIGRTCDLCGIKSKDGSWHTPQWGDNETEVSITARRAEYYGNDGYSEAYEIDLCPKCFWEELVPWLKSKGANVKEESFSW